MPRNTLANISVCIVVAFIAGACAASVDDSVTSDELKRDAGTTRSFDPAVSTTVTINANLIVEGTLRMRPNAGVTHTLRFTGANNAACVGGGMVPIASDVGLWVMGAGKLDVQGAQKTGWARPTSGLLAGASTIAFGSLPAGWVVGDELVIVPTRAGDTTGFETRTVMGVSGGTVTLNSPLTLDHPKVGSSAPEVANLTRTVRIEGTPTGYTHVFIHNHVPAVHTVKHAALRYVGVRNNADTICLGRYPLHFHMGDANNVGSVVDGVVVRQSGARGIVQHATHGTVAQPLTITDAVLYDIQEDAMWWDPGDENASEHILWDRILAARVWSPMVGSQQLQLAAFKLHHGAIDFGDEVRDSVAVGVQGSRFAAGFLWPEHEQAVWRFDRGNVSHNNLHHGFRIWHNGHELHDVGGFTLYHNGDTGIHHGAYANVYVFHDATLIGDGTDTAFLDLAVSALGTTGQRQSLVNATIDNFAVGMYVGEHNSAIAASAPVLVKNVAMTRTPRPVIIDDIGVQRSLVDFCNVTVDGAALGPAHLTFQDFHTGSVFRIQSAAGSARQWTSAGGWQSIPSFCP